MPYLYKIRVGCLSSTRTHSRGGLVREFGEMEMASIDEANLGAPDGDGNPRAKFAIGNQYGKAPLASDSATSAGFNAYQLRFNTSQKYTGKDINVRHIIAKNSEPYLSADAKAALAYRLSHPEEDETDWDEIMAEIEADAKEARTLKRKLPDLLGDKDTDGNDYSPLRRTRADVRPSNDSDGMPSSSRGSQPVISREDVRITDPTDDGAFKDEDDDAGEIKMCLVKGAIRKWVTRDEVRQFIANKFREFLLTYVGLQSEHEGSEYLWKINEMVSVRKCSLEIDINTLIPIDQSIAVWLFEAPRSVLEVMEEVANTIVFERYPNYRKIHRKIYVRITNLPTYDKMRSIRHSHLNTMIRIGGVVTQCSCVFPKLQQVKYDCSECGTILGLFLQDSFSQVEVGSCPECEAEGPFRHSLSLLNKLYIGTTRNLLSERVLGICLLVNSKDTWK